MIDGLLKLSSIASSHKGCVIVQICISLLKGTFSSETIINYKPIYSKVFFLSTNIYSPSAPLENGEMYQMTLPST